MDWFRQAVEKPVQAKRSKAEIITQPGRITALYSLSPSLIMIIELLLLIMWLIVAWLINDDTGFRDWSIGLVTGALAASVWLRLLSSNFVRRFFNGR